MSIVVNGSGTITGISTGGLPDGSVDVDTLAANSVTAAKIVDGTIVDAEVTSLAASKLTGALPAISGASLTNLPATDISGKANLSGAAFTGNCSLTTSGDSVFDIVGGNSGNSQIRFSDAAGSDRGRIHYEHSVDKMIFKVNGSNMVTIDSSGNVGIGVTPETWHSNTTALQIGTYTAIGDNGPGNTRLMHNTYYDSGGWKHLNTDEAAMIRLSSSGEIKFYTAVSGSADAAVSWNNPVTITTVNGGQFKIGNFQTNGTGYGHNFEGDDQQHTHYQSASGTGNFDFARYYNGNGYIGRIRHSSGNISFENLSDYRRKENVVPLTDATVKLKQLNPIRYNLITDETNTAVDGFLAHEVSPACPEAVSGEKDAMTTEEYVITPAVFDDEDNIITEAVMGNRDVIDPQFMDSSKLIPLLVKTIQELEARITTLEG
jgi:hypothetical protein